MPAKKIALAGLKFGFTALLVALVVWQILKNPDSAAVGKKFLHPHDGRLLGLGLLAALLGSATNILRWHMLVRTLGLQAALGNSLRIGFVAHTVSQVGFGLGLLGGDALKAVYLGINNPRQKAEAAATVVVDRLIGLMGLLLLAGIGTLLVDPTQMSFAKEQDQRTVMDIVWTVRALSLGAITGAVIVLLPGFTHWPLWDTLAHVPGIGPVLQRLVEAVRTYRRRADRLALGLVMTLLSQSMFVTALHLTVAGLDLPHPTLALHFVIGPIALITGALPIGAFELTMQLLYQAAIQHDGIVPAIAYRLNNLTIAIVGAVIYFFTRAETQALLDTAEKEAKLEENTEHRAA
jgi:hypothetical protein